ncbi:SLBB domain-containing protein [Nodosilinea sp. LEGE 07088]|uniref:SLBB domain-containing protein n=1 Tax=Nodosilinea sp. LEGE 07088 TaxID=2777968 RepID=UPI00187F1950|nr:SLBB domain-containing protein [Nodosilinea sp. LEGE 07088]MBE9137569.1 SLBB domain-containing protein [Nodosilinea sp. LEGE 07088]
MALKNYGLGKISLGLAVGLGIMAAAPPVLGQSMRQVTEPSSPAPPPSLDGSGSMPLQSDLTAELDAAYRLGIGDVVAVSLFGIEGYGGQIIVLQDGTINLPQIGQVFVAGLTFAEAEAALTTYYSRYVQQPRVTVSPVTLRPVRVAISGEVRRPGSYTVQRPQEDVRSNNSFDARFPTLTEAIAQAGGITADANISEVVLRRTTGYNQKQTSTYDLWELIQSGDLSKDVVLQGGDEIFIPTAVATTPQQASDLADANFAPDTINVYVAGEVDNPGQIQVPLNTSLNEVLLNAGGFNNRANNQTVDLIRLDANGTAQKIQIAVDFTRNVNDANNPILRDRDVIVVDRSGLTVFGDTTNTLLSPFTNIINSIFGFRRLFN